MFSDTHFHFEHFTQNTEINGAQVLSHMAASNCFFGLDIGTHCDDLFSRQAAVEKSISEISDTKLADRVRNFMYFSAGIWPDVSAIKERHTQIKTLREYISKAAASSDTDILHRKVIAIGEGGIDHHWNPSGVDGRCENDFDTEIYKGERELFEMQLELAKELKLPFIVHSRDGFEDTLDSIKNIGWNHGIIHCYSYGVEEAKAFLNLGWYISFSGSVTYTKKSKMDAMHELLTLVPEDRILLETDAPYLAPVPFRGQTNTPALVNNTYRFVAEHRKKPVEELCQTVDKNIRTLFNLK